MPASDEASKPGVAHSEIGMWWKPGAADFSDDEVLQDTLTLLREMEALGILDDLVLCIAAAQARRKRPGRKRKPGNPIVLYLAYVDLGCTSVQRFHSKLMDGFLELADYR